MKYIIGIMLCLSVLVNVFFYNAYRTYTIVIGTADNKIVKISFKSYTEPVLNDRRDTTEIIYADYFVFGADNLYYTVK